MEAYNNTVIKPDPKDYESDPEKKEEQQKQDEDNREKD